MRTFVLQTCDNVKLANFIRHKGFQKQYQHSCNLLRAVGIRISWVHAQISNFSSKFLPSDTKHLRNEPITSTPYICIYVSGLDTQLQLQPHFTYIIGFRDIKYPQIQLCIMYRTKKKITIQLMNHVIGIQMDRYESGTCQETVCYSVTTLFHRNLVEEKVWLEPLFLGLVPKKGSSIRNH